MEFRKINWFGIAGGIITLMLVVLALAYASPWWQLTIAEDLGQANISPLSYNLTILGSQIVIPLIFFLNLACQLSLAASAIAILIYSVIPDKSFSKHLLGFAYKKPLITLIIFLISIFAVTYSVQSILPITIPVTGASTITLEMSDITMEVPITTGFTWVFWLSIIAAILCVVARFYHKKIVSPPPKEKKT